MKLKKLLLLSTTLFLVGCGGVSGDTDSEEEIPSALPKVTWQWQLSGEINTNYDVDMYDIDLFNADQEVIDALLVRGKEVICYFSAGSYENFRFDADKFNDEDLGNTLDGWEGEQWVDIRSQNVRSIMQDRLDLAVEKNCTGVEPDNVDGYINNPGFDFTAQDQLDYNIFIATEAKKRGLSVGLKNDLNQVKELVSYFDFAINEQCHYLNECSLLEPFTQAGKNIFNAEYDKKYIDDIQARDAMCNDSIANDIRTLILPLELDDSFRYSCDK
jgi:hypothetical protein